MDDELEDLRVSFDPEERAKFDASLERQQELQTLIEQTRIHR